MTKHKSQKRRAFTLLETTMAMYITLMGVLVFAAMAVFANKVGMQAKIRTSAYQVANQQLEVLRTTSFDNLIPQSQTPFTVPEEFTSSLPGANNTKYQVGGSYTIESLSTTTKQISIRIQWRSAATPEGKTAPWSEVRLLTQVAMPGSISALTPASGSAPSVAPISIPLLGGSSSGGGILGIGSSSTTSDPTSESTKK